MTHDPARYSERLLPGIGGWSAVVALAVVAGIAMSVISATVGLAVGLSVLVLGVVAAWYGSPVVEVADGELVAGRARIPVTLLGDVQVLDRSQVGEQMGRAWDPRAFACLRTWAGGGIRAEVVDPRDPTPYWIVSSRRAADLAAAITTRA